MPVERNFSSLTKTMAILSVAVLMLSASSAPALEGNGFSKTIPHNSNNFRNLENAAPATQPSAQTPLVLPLFIQDHEFTSTLVMVNGSNQNTSGEVVLTGLDGKAIAHKQVEFTPHSQRRLEVYSLLQAAVSPATTGRITILHNPDPLSASILASLSLTYLGSSEPNQIDEEIATLGASGSQSLRAVADRAEGTPIVSLTSLSESAQHIQVQCLGAGEGVFLKQVELAAGETLLTKACAQQSRQGADFHDLMETTEEAQPRSVGISLTADAPPGSFAAFGFSPHRQQGDLFFSAVTFADPKMMKSPNTVFTGVPVGYVASLPPGEYAPQVTLANFSKKSIHARIKYARTAGEAPVVQEVASITVPAMASRYLSLNGIAGDPDLKNSFIVESDGAPGDLVAKLASANKSSLREVELLGKDQAQRDNGGSHPWSVENGNESTLLLFNHSDQPQHFNVDIGNGGELWQKTFLLQTMETRGISLRDLIETQAKDDTGKTLPRKLESGQISWFVPNPAAGSGRLLLSNPAIGMARSFSCSITVVICAVTGSTFDISLSYTETIINFGGITIIWCQPFSSGCSGVPNGTTGTASSYSWTTSAPAIVPISGSSTSQTVNLYGAALGTSQINETAYDGFGCSGGGGGPAPVTITVTIGATANPAPPAGIARSGGTATITPCATVGPAPSSYTSQQFTITTSAPQNPSNITLFQGATAQNWTTGFIAAGNSECASGTDIYNIQTATSNTNSGTLTYQVFGQPATNVTFKNASASVKVN